MDFVFFILGVAIGLMGYRYWFKRNPEALEALAAKIKAQARK